LRGLFNDMVNYKDNNTKKESKEGSQGIPTHEALNFLSVHKVL